MPFVSIIIPCYNDGKYLLGAVASARAQTYRNVEIIVVDDHSTDSETLSAISALRDSGVEVLSTPLGKKGLPAARNIGIAAASGEYILPLDSDDKIHPEYVAKAIAILDARPDVGICYCKARLFGLKSGSWKLPPYSWEEMLAGNMIFATAVFRKKDWETLGGYDESLLTGLEDYAFWLRLIALGREVIQIDEEFFHYRIKARSRTALIFEKKQEMKVLEDVYYSCEPVLRGNALLLFQRVHRLQQEKGELTCLVSWKLLRHVFALEWMLRQFVKRLLGRA